MPPYSLATRSGFPWGAVVPAYVLATRCGFPCGAISSRARGLTYASTLRPRAPADLAPQGNPAPVVAAAYLLARWSGFPRGPISRRSRRLTYHQYASPPPPRRSRPSGKPRAGYFGVVAVSESPVGRQTRSLASGWRLGGSEIARMTPSFHFGVPEAIGRSRNRPYDARLAPWRVAGDYCDPGSPLGAPKLDLGPPEAMSPIRMGSLVMMSSHQLIVRWRWAV